MQVREMFLGGMLTMGIAALLLVAVINLGGIVSFGTTTYYGNTIANVVVAPICFISGASNTAITFNVGIPGTNEPTWNVTTLSDSNGNNAGSITIQAGVGNALNTLDGNAVWIGLSSSAHSIQVVSNTVYSLSYATSFAGASTIGNFLSGGAVTGGVVPAPTQTVPSTSNTIYIGMRLPAGTPADTYTTNIILETSC
jgi:hypothetical protein